ncbi:dimethylmenaquinone methyltransferase [Bradyrhizobium sp. LTSP885]|nr:dimethylmenaquinone methyltransferase [Bradyrhizobium sp. LTSP885]
MSAADKPAFPPGFSIQPRIDAIPQSTVDSFRSVPTAHASDCMGRSLGARGLRAYHGDAAMCGRAITVRTRPGDNLMIHKAMEIAEEGDIIVVDGAGDLSQALVGGLMRTTAIKRKLGGFVIDGAVRDIAEFAEGGFACFALGHVHRGPSKEGPGEINVPIACAGLEVAPGDLVLGDLDGVIAIKPSDLPGLLDRVRAHAAREDKQRAAILAGTTDPDRFDAILRQKGVTAGHRPKP